MPPREHVIRVIREWVGKAESDYLVATRLFAMKDEKTYDAVCFHAQQCVEKYLKAILVDHSLPVPKTHDIEKLVGLSPHPLTVELTPEQMRWLTAFAADSRYPGGRAASEAMLKKSWSPPETCVPRYVPSCPLKPHRKNDRGSLVSTLWRTVGDQAEPGRRNAGPPGVWRSCSRTVLLLLSLPVSFTMTRTLRQTPCRA